MPRRLETGPLLVIVGALLLLVALFLPWYTGDLTAWEAFEVWDLVLAALALASIVAAIGLLSPDTALVDRRWLPAAVLTAIVVVAAEIINPPPAAAGQNPRLGAWLALGGAALMAAGALLTFSRVRLALTVEGRDPRRHVPAVDARGDEDTGDEPAVSPGASSLFGRMRPRAAEPPEPPSGAAAPDVIAAARAEEDEALRRSRERRRRRLEGGADEATQERPG
jgi:hypothetical protein